MFKVKKVSEIEYLIFPTELRRALKELLIYYTADTKISTDTTISKLLGLANSLNGGADIISITTNSLNIMNELWRKRCSKLKE